MRTLPYLLLALLLGGCASVSLERDFDPSRDFAAYRTWSWMDDKLTYQPDDARLKSDITEARISQAVAEQLDQRGLRQAADGKGDLMVQSVLIVDERQDQITTQYGGGWGGYWGGYWGGPAFTETRRVDYKVATLQIDLYDTKDGKLVWRGSGEQIMRSQPPTPAERERAIRETVTQVLSQYPPR
ncbi:DUF4136 domain-containing protein [Ectopseudomonas mendocina]|jgi:hypothetical protein|uniref:DUF4136 domain-containing protein n=1 Tax=Ectopseudomonas mendocina S5.2 TaxID=1225174 RepID=A0ABM5W0H5_ECTME|nr:DUF4136 domain-containing protein [Pseudomonas mendocina]ALN20729.1 hypothetical protein DW68_019485 [Pseudomonas mendocina S5.2]KER98350.1 hypothetical protein HN51_00540 [Pseudomonas mendocina]MDF2075540.1 DUF4136 domain-containing protein [Pseudomonas mendocina]